MDITLERILSTLNQRGKSQKQFAEKIGIRPNVISEWKAGKTSTYLKMIDTIADYLDVSVDYLLDRTPIPKGRIIKPKGDVATILIPVIGKVAAGYNALAQNDEDCEYIETLASELLDGYEYAWLKVTGDSMTPKIEDGDLVLIRLQEEVESGDIAVVIVDEEDGVIKRVKYGTNKVTLISENSDEYPPRVFQGQDVSRVRIWGKAIDLRRKLS